MGGQLLDPNWAVLPCLVWGLFCTDSARQQLEQGLSWEGMGQRRCCSSWASQWPGRSLPAASWRRQQQQFLTPHKHIPSFSLSYTSYRAFPTSCRSCCIPVDRCSWCFFHQLLPCSQSVLSRGKVRKPTRGIFLILFRFLLLQLLRSAYPFLFRFVLFNVFCHHKILIPSVSELGSQL